MDSRLFFELHGVLEEWEMYPWKSLKSPWIFGAKKGTNPVGFSLNAVARKSDFVLLLVRIQAELDVIQYYYTLL